MARAKKGPAPIEEAGGFLQIGRGSKLTGKLSGRGVAVCCGEVHGHLAIDGEVIVTTGGRLDLLTCGAEHLAVEGEAKGIFKLRDGIEVHETGLIEGEVSARRLAISPGGRVDADLRIGSEEPPKDAPES